MATSPARHQLYRVACETRSRDVGDSIAAVYVLSWPTGPDQPRSDCSVALSVVGELDACSAPEIARVIMEVADSVTDLALDLGEVTFADAAAVSLLVSLHQQLAQKGGRLTLSSVSSAVDRLLGLTGVGQLFREPTPWLCFDISHRQKGQVVDIAFRGDVSAGLADAMERILRIVSIRQPTELWIDLTATTGNLEGDPFAQVDEAVASFGGVTIVSGHDERTPG